MKIIFDNEKEKTDFMFWKHNSLEFSYLMKTMGRNEQDNYKNEFINNLIKKEITV